MKRIIKVVWEELLYGSHLTSLGAVGITLSVILIFDLPIKTAVLIISYLVYQIIYSYNHVKERFYDKKSNPERVQHLSNKRKWFAITPLIYAVILGGFLLISNLSTVFLVIFIAVGGILYTEYFKSVPILGWKTYYVSFFWSILVLIIPFFYSISNIIPFLYLVVFIFARGIVNTAFSDIKDIESDKIRKLKTFAVYFGRKKTLYMLHIINIFSLFPLIVGVIEGHLPMLAFSLVITVINGIYYLTKAIYIDQKSLRHLSYVLIDGEYILWPVIIFICSSIT